MRLLRRAHNGEFCLTEDLDETVVPPYAILSHTWAAEAEEVSFEDIQSGVGRTKLGYKKIRFCGTQAEQDKLQYFWVDTCCIDKANKAEFSHAINSMYRWYANSKRCYVYLADVLDPADKLSPPLKDDLRKSRWFSRGWTLQELLAPEAVDFFTVNWQRLGDKASLQQHIHEITGISHAVLQGAPLAQLDVEERLSWNVHRLTTLEEDKIYSLLGIFDVYLSPFYGEGASKARDRLIDQIKQRERCIQDLRPGDPRDDKKRIEETKGGLLEDAYSWVLDNTSFQQWLSDPNSPLLWIKGDPGKGKTMLMCGIINELQKAAGKSINVSYFFCQATDSRINNATAVLRGLLYMIISQRPSLVSHVRKKYDEAGKSLFDDANAWTALTEISANILRDPNLGTAYLIVDALDECMLDLPKLLNFVAENLSVSSRVKWIVSSRNWPDIEERLERAGHKVRLSLELNAESVATAVGVFIKKKVSDLAQRKKYDEQTRYAVLEHLLSNANDTFLWVALVCQSLESTAKRNVQKKLSSFPPGLGSLYERMMQQISTSDDAELCKQVLASVALVYRPVTLLELAAIVEQLEDQVDDLESIQEVVELCGSFLTLRQGTIYFVHQSAQDFLLDKAAAEVYPSGREEVHHSLFTRSLQALFATLHRDMYGLNEPGYSIDDIEPPNPDPLAASCYSCVYWVDHLQDALVSPSSTYTADLQDGGVVDTFIRKKYLYWLEALSLCKRLPQGVVSIARLQSLVKKQGQATQLIELLYDALRFAMYYRVAIKCSPLQTYAAALIFSPTNSLVRQLFQAEAPKDTVVKPAMQESWSACLQTLEGHSFNVYSVIFSSDSTWLASGSGDCTVKIWDAGSGTCLQTLEGHSNSVCSLALSSDSTRLASGSYDRTIKIWDVGGGTCLQTLEGHMDFVGWVVFSSDSTRLASGSYDRTIKIWDADSGACLQTLEGHMDSVLSVAFSSDSTRLASGSYDMTIKIWDAGSGTCLRTLEGHNDSVYSVAFSSDSTRLASGSYDRTIKIWDASSRTCLQTLVGHSGNVFSVAFSSDSTQLASGSGDCTVKIWDTGNGACLRTLEGHSNFVHSIAFSSNSTRLASGSFDRTIKIWDASSGMCLQTFGGHSDSVHSVAMSSNSTWLASGSGDCTVKIWDAGNGACLQTLEGHSDSLCTVTFSSDSTWLASGAYDYTVKIWDADSGACLQTHTVSQVVKRLCFDSTRCYIKANAGVLALGACTEPYTTSAVQPEHFHSTGVCVSMETSWIAYDGRKMLWIPSEYRGICSSACNNTIGIGTRLGKVWMCTFNYK